MNPSIIRNNNQERQAMLHHHSIISPEPNYTNKQDYMILSCDGHHPATIALDEMMLLERCSPPPFDESLREQKTTKAVSATSSSSRRTSSSSFDMTCLARSVCCEEEESPTNFPLIEWCTDDKMYSNNNNNLYYHHSSFVENCDHNNDDDDGDYDGDNIQREQYSSCASSTISSTSHAYSFIDTFLEEEATTWTSRRRLIPTRGTDHSRSSPTQTMSVMISSTMSSPLRCNKNGDDRTTIEKHHHNNRGRLVRSIALESHLALLDSSTSTSNSKTFGGRIGFCGGGGGGGGGRGPY
jgi:hypothetical protein